MTANKNFKRLVRARAAKTGESYTAALRHFLPAHQEETMSHRPPFRLAVGQLPFHGDPSDVEALRVGGSRVRELLEDAHSAGARLLQLPEGAICFPHKDFVADAGWDRAAWNVLQEELERTATLAGELRTWVVLGAPHRLGGNHRPHNSLYVISDGGVLHTRYDERFLSHTKATRMYSPGLVAVTFEVDGWRFGCALGIECHFPEVFTEYEELDVDGVLFCSTGNASADATGFALECQGHAAVNGLWLGFAVPPQPEPSARSGVLAPGGRWVGQVPAATGIVTVDLAEGSPDVVEAVTLARPWRRSARRGPTVFVDDARSGDRSTF